jgi:hypothetical protein
LQMYYYTTILHAIQPALRYPCIFVQALHVSCKQCTVFIPIKEKRLLRTFISISSHIVQNLPPGKLISSSDPILFSYSPPLPSSLNKNQAKSKPNPFIQARYLVTISAHAACGSLAVENSMHSSRAAFSSLHTQQGLTLGAPSSPGGLFEEARLLIWEEALAVREEGLGLVGLRWRKGGGWVDGAYWVMRGRTF